MSASAVLNPLHIECFHQALPEQDEIDDLDPGLIAKYHPDYAADYQRKWCEAAHHPHKRAQVLPARTGSLENNRLIGLSHHQVVRPRDHQTTRRFHASVL